MQVKYRVIERLRENYPVSNLCQVLEVSRSSYYAWRKTIHRADRDAWLKEKIMECQNLSNFTYGYRCIQKWLKEMQDRHVNLKRILRVARLFDALAQIRR